MLKKTFIPFLTILFIISCQKSSKGLKQSDISYLVNSFLHAHAQYHTIDDTISERILKNYISRLDYGKNYFVLVIR